jgi:hypothetical protein
MSALFAPNAKRKQMLKSFSTALAVKHDCIAVWFHELKRVTDVLNFAYVQVSNARK